MPDKELDRCILEQRGCMDYIASGGPDSAGAWAGLTDWLMEEAIIRQESAHA